MFCPNCGAKLDDDMSFCPSCGQAIPPLHQNTPPNTSCQNKKQSASQFTSQRLIGLLGLIGGLICIFFVLQSLIPMLGSNTNSVKNKTQNPYTAVGLSFVGTPTWDVTVHRDGGTYIEITGKIRADTWIGSQVYVQATFYDKDGATLGIQGDMIGDLEAGETWAYEIVAYYDNLSYFTIDGVTY